MTELRKTGANEYDAVADGQVIGQVWNWHGKWSAEASGETHHGLKIRKEAVAKVERIHRSKR
jgi:hypothetical protein